MEILLDVIKLALIPAILLGLPIFMILIFDIAAHLGEFFGGE